jgi:hypothetical protein
MDRENLEPQLQGCYVTVPTMFRDPTLEIDLPAIPEHVLFLKQHGLNHGNFVLLADGAAGDFSTMSPSASRSPRRSCPRMPEDVLFRIGVPRLREGPRSGYQTLAISTKEET